MMCKSERHAQSGARGTRNLFGEGYFMNEEAEKAAKQAETKKQNSIWFKVRKYGPFPIEVIGLGVLIWYASTTNKLWKASLEANRISRNNGISQTRAYVLFDPNATTQALPDPKNTNKRLGFSFRVPFENYGLSPTSRLHVYVNSEVRDTKLPDDFSYEDKGDHIRADLVLGPRQRLSSLPIVYKIEDLVASELPPNQSGHRYTYLYGWLSYHDIFEGTEEHVSKFCYEIWMGGNLALNDAKSPAVARFDLCPHHNCRDEDCTHEPSPSPPDNRPVTPFPE
jgi:hypothetical protein